MSSSPTDPSPGRGAVEVTMPETGSADAARLVSWIRGPGARVEQDEPICLVQVGELTAQIVSPSAGVMGGIYAAVGDEVPAGASLAEVLPIRIPSAPPEPPTSVEEDVAAEVQELIESTADAAEPPEPELEAVPDEGASIPDELDPEPAAEEADPAIEPDAEERPSADPLRALSEEIRTLAVEVPQMKLPREPKEAFHPPAELPSEEELAEIEAEAVAEFEALVEAAEDSEAEPEPAPPEERVDGLEEPVAEIDPQLPVILEPPPPVDLAGFHSPAVRALAATHRVDLATIKGTGRDGRVTREDVLAVLVDPAPGVEPVV